MDVVDTRANASTVLHTLTEDGEELLVRPGVLDGDHIGVHVNDGVDDVVEVGVAHVGVDLSRDGSQLECRRYGDANIWHTAKAAQHSSRE